MTALYYPGLWLPTGSERGEGHLIVHREGARREVLHLPCPQGALRRLLDFWDAIGREPMTLKVMQEVIRD